MSKNHFIFVFLFVDLLFVDQFSKMMMYFNGEYHLNTAIAFSLPVRSWALVFLYVVAFFALWQLWSRQVHRDQSVSWVVAALVLSGALGNLIDRLVYGGVVDFISVGDWFPVFNFADVYLSLAGILIVVFSRRLLK